MHNARGWISWKWLVVAAALAGSMLPGPARAGLEVGFGEADLTPEVEGGGPVWIAGYGQNRRATGVHDPLWARAVVLRDGGRKVALVSVDLVGLQYAQVLEIRGQLPGFAHVTVSSTHNHEGPDVIGLWGPTPLQSGVNPQYLELVVRKSVEAVRAADGAARPARAAYGTAEDRSGLLRDARLPKVYDPVLRVLKFTHADGGQPLGLLVQWNCHPESLGAKNTMLTADFPATTVSLLRERHACPVAYFTGAVGGLMTNPANRYRERAGGAIADDTFEYAQAYGAEVADLADRAVAAAEPIVLTPLEAAARPVAFPLTNPLYHAARGAGVLKRQAYQWTGDANVIGPPLEGGGKAASTVTEVAYLRLGELHVACIPGELYPELVYGEYQEPVEPGADFPDAPLEPPVMRTLPGKKALLLGLANDEIGYIIPKRQWDYVAPYAYQRKSRQYGEINSCGEDVAPILMRALADRVAELGPLRSTSP